jgi:AcrR family transcriptional regulator
MAAQPILRALHARLIAEGRELGHDATADGEAEATYAVVRHILDGLTMTAVAKALNCSRGLLYTWATTKKHPERWTAIEEARKIAAHGLVDDAQAILDESNPAMIAVDRERAKLKQWMASRYNRAAYGEDRANVVSLSIGDLHIAALTGGLHAAAVPDRDLQEQTHIPQACETVTGFTASNDAKPLLLTAALLTAGVTEPEQSPDGLTPASNDAKPPLLTAGVTEPEQSPDGPTP